jgi:S1-C subfamily serine protease
MSGNRFRGTLRSTPNNTSKARYRCHQEEVAVPYARQQIRRQVVEFLIEVSSVMTRTSRLRYDKSPPADSKRRAGARPTIPSPLGLTLAPANSEGEGQGVVVTNVDPAVTAAQHGMRTGDVIIDVAGRAVNLPAQVRDAVNEAKSAGKHTVLMRVKSGDSTHFVALPVATG